MFKWMSCPKCRQSCTGQYLKTPGCHRCGWYLGQLSRADELEIEFRKQLAEKASKFNSIPSFHNRAGRPSEKIRSAA